MRQKTVFKGEGFPPKFIQKQGSESETAKKEATPITRDEAISIGNEIIAYIRSVDSSVRVSFAGSIRRGVDQVHDIDLLVSPYSPHVLEMVQLSGHEILWSGRDKVSFMLEKTQVDIRFIPPESWGPALQYFTGSREHNISLRSIAKSRNLVLNEHGLFDQEGHRIDDGTEGSIYTSLKLRWLPPKYRNGFIRRTREPVPIWCIEHQEKDWCKRSRYLARKSNDRKEVGNLGGPELANPGEPRKGETSLKNPGVITPTILQDNEDHETYSV